jgi:hypothetical protein
MAVFFALSQHIRTAPRPVLTALQHYRPFHIRDWIDQLEHFNKKRP